MNTETLWRTKLAARIHDPAEKALVLMRDPAGHEGGTSSALVRLLGLDQAPSPAETDDGNTLSRVLFRDGLSPELYRHVQRADWWAAAADRPQWPMEEITVSGQQGNDRTLAVAPWAQVHWTREPVLKHPLTGEEVELPGGLSETDLPAIKDRSFDHFSELLVKLGAGGDAPQDLRKTLLAFWRFGPDLSVTDADTQDHGKLGKLWEILPADTRVPDHSIWDHLDLTSAFAGAFAADPDGEAALLSLSLGPVQPFIAAARTTSDLWAGSHLLSRLSWEAMRPLCERLGPDAILFPRLRGIPQVDMWLRDIMGLPGELFKDCDWMEGGTDANPLFSAALPNRFVAVVPASEARTIAETIEREVRQWLEELGEGVVSRLLKEAGYDVENTETPYEQMKAQLQGFPEVHWAAVPFSLIHCRDPKKQRDLDTTELSAAMAPFFGAAAGDDCGFLESHAWQVLQDGIEWRDNTTFFAPNPGVLYPAVHELAERVLAAAKTTRTFPQSDQQGWRDSLTGEHEWLTTDRTQLHTPPGQRTDTLWARIAETKPSWARKGEHLGALSAIKRLWPNVFTEEARKALAAGEWGEEKQISRFVVSTHTMALAHQLDRWLANGHDRESGIGDGAPAVALPRKLVLKHWRNPALETAKRLPGLLETARDDEDETAYDNARRQVEALLGRGPEGAAGRLETYYALLLMDGDRMGAILAGDESTDTAISYRESFHPRVRKGFDERAGREPLIEAYGNQKRSISPNRHLAISGALNDFSQVVVRHIVEQECLGRLIYAGGDDVLAMLPVADLLPAMGRLRQAYSGTEADGEDTDWGDLQGRDKLVCKRGFAWLNGQLMRMMGSKATASCGAVIAHHQAPLSAILRELRTAEKRAKTEGERDAFSIVVVKRSGGALHLTAHWPAIGILLQLTRFLRQEGVSRRAVYNSIQWLRDLPDPRTQPAMLENLLAYQMARQTGGQASAEQVPELARRLTELAVQQTSAVLPWLENFLSVAEFLARETRAGEDL